MDKAFLARRISQGEIGGEAVAPGDDIGRRDGGDIDRAQVRQQMRLDRDRRPAIAADLFNNAQIILGGLGGGVG